MEQLNCVLARNREVDRRCGGKVILQGIWKQSSEISVRIGHQKLIS